MKHLTPALLLFALACPPPPPSLDAAVDVPGCGPDAGVTVRWSSPDADVVLLLDGDRPSVEQQSGKKWIAADRPKLVRIAAMRESSTSWSVSKVEACVEPRDGGVGVILLGNGSPAAAQPISVNGVETTSDVAGQFAVPDGRQPYSLVYSFAYGPFLDLHTTVLLEGATVSSPVVHSPIGNLGRSADLVVRVTSDVATVGRGYFTTVIARVGGKGNVRDLSAVNGAVSIPSFYWEGPASTKVTVTAVRLFMRSLLTGDSYDRPDILGASPPVEVELREGESAVVDVHVERVEGDVRDLYLPSELGNTVAYVGYGAPREGPTLYSGRAQAQTKLPVVRRSGYWDEWAVSEPSPRDGEFENGTRGSGDFVVPREGPVVAPLYRAPRLTSLELPLSEPVLQWDMPQPCLCRAWIQQRFEDWVVYSVGPVDLRKAGINFPGSYQVTLDCYPELASVDDLLTGQRGLDFAQGVGRRARVQTVGTLVLR